MNFWRKGIAADLDAVRAEAIMPKKRRKQKPGAKGLSAVSIGRVSKRSMHQRNEDRYVLSGSMAEASIGEQLRSVKLLNLSSNGVMIAYDGPLRIGERISIAIEACAPVNVAVRWVRAGRVGLEFAAETVIIAEAGVQDFIIRTIAREEEATQFKPGTTIGAEQRGTDQRHRLVWLGKIRIKGHEATARLRNISATGAMVSMASGLPLQNGDGLELALETIGRLKASVRWIAGRQIGIEFAEPFDVAGLVHEACAQLAPDDDAQGLAPANTRASGRTDDTDDMTIRLGMVENPHHPPEMQYGRLTLD